MLKAFLKPTWVLFTLFVIFFSYFAFTLLAPWQLNKDHRIVERNEAIQAAFESDPVAPSDVFDDAGALREGKEWTRVELHGHYLADKEVLLRLRPVASGPVYQSLVPFESDGRVYLINRGWIAAGPANAVPEIPPAPAEDVTITAMARKAEPVHDSAPIVEQNYQQVYTINPQQIAGLISTPLAADYLQISHQEPGVLSPIPLPQLERGNHLSYGFQWIAFGIMAPLGLGYFVFAEIRERRRMEEESAAVAAPAADSAAVETPAAPTAPAPSSAPASSVSRRERSRYGDNKRNPWAK